MCAFQTLATSPNQPLISLVVACPVRVPSHFQESKYKKEPCLLDFPRSEGITDTSRILMEEKKIKKVEACFRKLRFVPLSHQKCAGTRTVKYQQKVRYFTVVWMWRSGTDDRISSVIVMMSSHMSRATDKVIIGQILRRLGRYEQRLYERIILLVPF